MDGSCCGVCNDGPNAGDDAAAADSRAGNGGPRVLGNNAVVNTNRSPLGKEIERRVVRLGSGPRAPIFAVDLIRLLVRRTLVVCGQQTINSSARSRGWVKQTRTKRQTRAVDRDRDI